MFSLSFWPTDCFCILIHWFTGRTAVLMKQSPILGDVLAEKEQQKMYV